MGVVKTLEGVAFDDKFGCDFPVAPNLGAKAATRIDEVRETLLRVYHMVCTTFQRHGK